MNLQQFYEPGPETSDRHTVEPSESRGDLISRLQRPAVWDLVVIGGGVHGAAFARVATLNGLRVVLLEKHDYAAATSSRSSKMAHGGLRYLELLDFQQVFEGIKSREELFRAAPHLVQPEPFLFPFRSESSFFRFKLGVGLKLYDLFVRDRERRHRWVDAHEFQSLSPAFREEKLQGGYLYYDGLMRDARLVMETIIAARQEGALALNYVSVDSVSQGLDGRVVLGWTDRVGGTRGELAAGVAINCAGPWAPTMGRVRSDTKGSVVYSRGSHLLFDKKWEGPSLIMPLAERSRYYFVWPHPAGTLVGTTERVMDEPELDPQPSADEVNEILDRLAADLPNSGLNRQSLHYAFAGVRTLPVRKSRGRPSGQLSRKHIWNYANGMLTLLGGKYTTAVGTAFEGLEHVFRLSKLNRKPVPVGDRLLPGAAHLNRERAAFELLAAEKQIPADVVNRAVGRLGSRVRHFQGDTDDFDLIAGVVLRGEIRISIEIEQAVTVEDVIRRRLELEYLPGNGTAVASTVQAMMPTPHGSGVDEERLEKLRRVLEGA